MNRWDEGSRDSDPHRHGRFTIIVNRGYDSLYNNKADAWLLIPPNSYSVHDTMDVQHPWLCFKEDEDKANP